ncbi:MAG TPA: DUF3048 domain-containing protein, partial [Armatimonadota bacterium]|nr:DUF3048 domain-containing protein [Armatimonadota bacterium]
EGGITRFLAIFLHGNPPVIGPVRSSRPHFINLEREYNAAYVHCGQSYEALQILATDPTIYNLDQMIYAKPFWRDHSRKAPHNLYTSMEKLRKQEAKLRWDAPVNGIPAFTSTKRLTSGLPGKVVEIHFPGATAYRLRLVYDAKLGGYKRYMDGKLHVDRETHKPIIAKNVIIQRVYAAPFMQSTHGTFDVEVVGRGQGVFMSGGFQENIHWRKDTLYAVTQYADDYNGGLPFRPGQTWVEIVPVDGIVLFRNTDK